MADSRRKGIKAGKEPELQQTPKGTQPPKSNGDKEKQNAEAGQGAPKPGPSPSSRGAKVDLQSEKLEPAKGKLDLKAQKEEAEPRNGDRELSKKDEKESGNRKSLQAFSSIHTGGADVVLPGPKIPEVLMFDKDGNVMVDEEGNPHPGHYMFDLLSDPIRDKKGNAIPGRYQYNEAANAWLDAEGYPIVERQETKTETQHREAGQLWARLHEHLTYLQNPRYASENPKHIQALRIFRWEDTPEGKQYVLLIRPCVADFDGFEPLKTYVQHLRIFNMSPWSQRIRVIKPQTHEYFISSTENPFQGKTLVSGDKCDFDVTFQPPSTWCFEDEITVKTEMDTCAILLKAINPYPVVVLPAFVDMGLCLAGHTVAYHYTITSKGAGAKFSWCRITTDLKKTEDFSVKLDSRYDDLEDSYYKNNVFSVPPFILYPHSFSTTSDSKQEFIVLFRPPRAGVFYTYLQLGTSTLLHWEIMFKATGVDLQLDLQKFEGMDFRRGQRELGVDFGRATVSHTISKEVTVKSYTSLPLRFFWRLQSKHVNAKAEVDPECTITERSLPIPNLLVFVADPGHGVFAKESETPIKFNFTPSDLANYHQVATLYVDTRSPMPLGSDVWKDFREALRLVEYEKANFCAQMNWNDRVLWGIDASAFQCGPKQIYQDDLKQISSCFDDIFHVSQVENGGTIFRMIELDLTGSGTYFDVTIVPALLQFSGVLTLGQTHIKYIEMVNESPAEVLFTWEEHKNPYGVGRNSAYIFPVTGKIGAKSSKKIQVTTGAKQVGRLELLFHCLVESVYLKGQLPLVLKVEGHVSGPNVIITPFLVDFGLCQRDSPYTMEIQITNKSKDSSATFKIFSTRDSQVPRSDPMEEESQINPLSSNSKVPVGCSIFDITSKVPILPPSPELGSLLQPHSDSNVLPSAQQVQQISSMTSGQQIPQTTLAASSEASEPHQKLRAVPTSEAHDGTKGSVQCPSLKVVKTPISPRPLDREVSTKFLTEPQERAWISSAYGEVLQVFNDGITDPKLPRTTLLHQRDTVSGTTLPPLRTGFLPQNVLASAILKGIKALSHKKMLPPLTSKGLGESTIGNIPPPATDLHHSFETLPLEACEVHPANYKQAPSSIYEAPRARNLAKLINNTDVNLHVIDEDEPLSPPRPYWDTSVFLDESRTKIPLDDLRHTKFPKPFWEQMGDVGQKAKSYEAEGPPIIRKGKNYASYEEDLLQTLIFEPSEGDIPKGGDNCVKVKVTLVGTICGFMRLAIVCEISGGLSPTQYSIARAHIDAPEACLLPCFVDLRTKFINIPITLSVVIRNMKALPACYNWPPRDRIGEVQDLDVDINPQRGEIPPKLEWTLTFKLIPRKLGLLDTVLICNVFKMICPLGLQLKAIIVDVRISYYVFRPDREDGHQKSGRKVAHERILLKRQQDALGNPVEEEDPDNWVDPPVPCLDFGRRRELGKAHCLKLVARNHSPIETTINLSIGQYHSEPLASLVRDEAWVISSLTERLSYLIPNRRDPFQSAFKNKGRQHPPLTDLSDTHLKYFNQPGKQMLWRRAEGAMHEALIREGYTVAFLCYPAYSGTLKPWGDWSCEIVCFSNLPGDYMDILTSKVGRLKPVEIPMEVQIIGTPLVARRNWLEPTGLQQPPNEGEITVAWQPTAAGCPSKTKQIWVRNQSTFHIEVRWELKKQRIIDEKFVTMQFEIEEDLLAHALLTEVQDLNEEDPKVHLMTKEHIGIVYDQQVHVVFRDYLKTVEYEEAAFSISPDQQVILGHSSYPFTLDFRRRKDGLYSFIYVAYCRVFDGRNCERRRSTQFVFDKISDRPDEQYTFRRPEKKHICEHVITFHTGTYEDKFAHNLAHKTTIVDPADPEMLALQLNEDGSKPRSLSRYHCSEASNSGSEEDEKTKPPLISTEERRRQSKAKASAYLENMNDSSSDRAGAGEASTSAPEGVKDLVRESAYSVVHDIAYESEEEPDDPKYQFDMKRRSSQQREVSTGRSVNFFMDQPEVGEDLYGIQYKGWHTTKDVFLDEIMGTKHAKNFSNFESIRPLRVSLEAIVLIPRLKTNVSEKLHERLSFHCYGNDPPEIRSDTQALYITNEYPQLITFSITFPGEPFEVMNIRKGVVKPVERGKAEQRMSLFNEYIGYYELEPGKTMQFNITFRPVINECLLNPQDMIFAPSVNIDFIDDYHQVIPLYGELLFPELRLMADKVCLGAAVNATGTQTTDFSLSNPSLPDADWRLVTEQWHQNTVALALRGIPPKWEDAHGLDKVWPIIWSANPERGKVRGRRDVEMSESMAEHYHWNKGIVTISFSPFDIAHYSQVVYVEVRLGRGVKLTLEGTGVDESPPTPPPPRPEEPKGKKKKSDKEVKKAKK